MDLNVDKRKADLAKIHIAKKDLGLDEDTYRTIVRSIGGAASGSSADLDIAGRARVLHHLRSKGWRPQRIRKTAAASKRTTATGQAIASHGEVRMIRSLWIQMADAGAVENRSEQGLRAWVQSATRRYHYRRMGWSAPEFLPDWVACRVIEHLKQWGARCNVRFDG